MKNIRLSKFVKPERYRLMIRPDMEAFTFYGEETIFLAMGKSTREVVLHSKDLDIFDVKFQSKNFKCQTSKIKYNEKAETATFIFSKALPKGSGELSLKFKGVLSEGLKGFYRSKYIHEGREKHIATTQFESTDARRAFPCFDEPAHKAIFDVTMQIPSHLTAISNTIETEILEHDGGYKTVNFAPSPKMSTYLLAFIVGEFEFLETKSKHGVVVRVFTTPGKKHQAKFALDTAARCLDFYDDYFDIKYPLPILDLIALPDFASAAMENWGAITYRETALLVDEQHTSAANKQWVAIVIAHELAHQWFGNLVTMHWWTDLWLNEGFASYMEHLGTHRLFPKWNIWEQYVSGRMATAFKLDALSTSHPIEIEVRHPSEISEIFDMVSYAKGSAVIRMLAEYLGEKDFRDGLRHYLKKHAYGNTITEDLWKAFEHVSKKPVRKIMETWTGKTGYPLISAQTLGNKIRLTQKRFFSSEVSAKKFKDNTVWKTPVQIIDGNDKRQKFLMKEKSLVISNPTSWLKINSGETSFFRTHYSKDLLEKLEGAIKAGKLSANDRLGVIRDAFGLAEAGQAPTVEALKLAGYYIKETTLPVWEEISSGLASSGTFYKNESWYPKYEAYALSLYKPLVKSLGWDKKAGEGHTTGLLRSLALSAAGTYGDKNTISKAKKLFAAHLKGKTIAPDLRSVVYNIVAQNGGVKEFAAMAKLYKEALPQPEEQDRVGRAMGSFKHKKALQKVLDFALSKVVRPQDAPSIFIGVARNFYGVHLAWKFLNKNWPIINKNYNVGGHLLEWFIVPFSRFTTTKEAKEFEAFFKKHPVPNLKRVITQVLERIYSNQAWIKRDRANIEVWLNKTIND